MTTPADIATVVQEAQTLANGNPTTAAPELQALTIWLIGDIASSLRTIATALSTKTTTGTAS